MEFREILDTSELYKIVEQIEELAHEKEPVLVRIRTDLIAELKAKTGYDYIL